jgi:hypothetical protein
MLTSFLDTVATFFPAKEETSDTNWAIEDSMPRTSDQLEKLEHVQSAQENMHASHKPPSRDVFSPADLRDEIYDDMNGGECVTRPCMKTYTRGIEVATIYFGHGYSLRF